MRKIHISKITAMVKKLCIDANYYLTDDIKDSLQKAKEKEKFPIANNILDILIKNAELAAKEHRPICQDTGMAIVFLEVGQEVHIVGGSIEDAVNEGVRQGYIEGYLRKSVVSDPIERMNTNDNTPAIIHYTITTGDRLKIIVAPKGFGSENMSQIKMLRPADGIEGVKKFVLQVIKEAGPNPCPPIVVGVGIGGSFEKAGFLAKKALIRSTNERNHHPVYADLEGQLLEEINSLGIGPQGFGGRSTALAVNIETYATHIAGLPVAVNINCHATRHKEVCL